MNEELLEAGDLYGSRYPGIGTVDHSEVLAALQEAHERNEKAYLRTKEGDEFYLHRVEGSVQAESVAVGGNARMIPEFAFLDPDAEVRLKELRDIVDGAPLWFPNVESWESKLQAGPLSESDLAQLVRDIQSLPNYVFDSINNTWAKGGCTANDLIPESPFYYQTLLGPFPENQDLHQYIKSTLLPHWRSLLANNSKKYLGFLLPLFLHPQLAPSIVINAIDFDTVFDAASTPECNNNPFALLGVLDIALKMKNTDPRFDELAVQVGSRILDGEIVGSDGVDYYMLMPSLVRLCFRTISKNDKLFHMPLYWRWLAAFVHSHFVMGVLRGKLIEIESFSAWCDSHFTSRIFTAELVDLQKSPSWQAERLSSDSLKNEVFGRLVSLTNGKGDLDVPPILLDAIKVKVNAALKDGTLLFSMAPGPLEGHLRRQDVEPPVADSDEASDMFNNIEAEIASEPSSELFNRVAGMSLLIRYPEKISSALIESVNGMKLTTGSEEGFFSILRASGYIAATQPDEFLANAVAQTVVKNAAKFQSASDAGEGYRILFWASAAFVDRNQWLQWLSNSLRDYAHILPRGVTSAWLYDSLDELKSLIPIKDWCFGSARMSAAGAIF